MVAVRRILLLLGLGCCASDWWSGGRTHNLVVAFSTAPTSISFSKCCHYNNNNHVVRRLAAENDNTGSTAAPRTSETTRQQPNWSESQPTRLVELLPSGRVQDPNAWLQLCSDSLQQLTGKSLTRHLEDRAGHPLPSLDDVHTHERFAFLSHGSQEDPVFCYFNRAAVTMFQYDEETELYKLPSRYSAPSGGDRSQRQKIIDGTAGDDLGYYHIPTAVRQVKSGALFEIRDILLWNVYDKEGYRVGQAAIYDRDKVVMLDPKEEAEEEG